MAGAGRRSGWSEVYAKTPMVAAGAHPTLTNQNFKIDAARVDYEDFVDLRAGQAVHRAGGRLGHTSTIYIVRLK